MHYIVWCELVLYVSVEFHEISASKEIEDKRAWLFALIPNMYAGRLQIYTRLVARDAIPLNGTTGIQYNSCPSCLVKPPSNPNHEFKFSHARCTASHVHALLLPWSFLLMSRAHSVLLLTNWHSFKPRQVFILFKRLPDMGHLHCIHVG